jgi:hypothetical protein
VCKRKISLAELQSVAKCKGCLEVFCAHHRGQVHESACGEYAKYMDKKKAEFSNGLLNAKTQPSKLDTV